MEKKEKIFRIVYIIGVVLLIIGILDPMEGSVVIGAGSILIALSAMIIKDRHKKLFLIFMSMILIGVFFLFYLSSLGGLGEGYLSYWWGLLMLPYPLGWLASVILLIVRAVKNRNKRNIEKVS